MDEYNNQNVAYPQNQQYDPTKEVMTVGQYVGMFIINAIPVVNIICWIVWLCSSKTNKNKKNYCIASIVLWVIGMVLVLILYAVGAAMGLSTAEMLSEI